MKKYDIPKFKLILINEKKNKNKFPDKKRVPSTSEAKQFYKKTYKT